MGIDIKSKIKVNLNLMYVVTDNGIPFLSLQRKALLTYILTLSFFANACCIIEKIFQNVRWRFNERRLLTRCANNIEFNMLNDDGIF